ncbi:interleukin-2 receptor subunit beta isoform X1 [Perca flavescens]|uniref:interleukin-2 receptor subunit beta isoform X1 n=2 Tax=Perca flavescens TaxID=8167 RepID=UPI00106E748A|nr:interleukin-2 receptor subunit beta isoform X1 [Perca flavescens]
MSPIVVKAMEILVSSYVLLVLASVHAAQSHKGSQGLSCVNDFVNNVSCTWDSSPVAPGVDCWIVGVKTTWISENNQKLRVKMSRSCKLKQHRNSPPGCSFVFENEEFNSFSDMPYISMQCNGTLVENITNYSPYNHIKMHPPGVPNVSSTANETRISWSQDSRRSHFFTSFDFEVQIKEKKQTWNEARTLYTQEEELRISALKLKGHHEVRVRVKPTEPAICHWSNWSPTTAWVGATDMVETSQDHDWLLFWTSLVICGVMLSLGLITVMLVVYRSCSSRGLLKGKPVPNPSKYFHSVHGGNLKKWLKPLPASESFFVAQPCDRISPVELCESWDVVPSTSPSSSTTSALLHFRSYPSASSATSRDVDHSSYSSSCFSNKGYFMSTSSGSSARSDPNPAYFTYHDDFYNLHNSHNLHVSLCPSLDTSQTYESLKREPQSPDSGFGLGKEDEEGEDDKMVVDVEGKEVSNDHHSPPLFILPFHLPSRMCPPSSAPPPPNAPSLTPIPSDSEQEDVPLVASSGSYAAWPMADAMCRSSSMPVEPCKTGYLTLKELQTTFSNKSI